MERPTRSGVTLIRFLEVVSLEEFEGRKSASSEFSIKLSGVISRFRRFARGLARGEMVVRLRESRASRLESDDDEAASSRLSSICGLTDLAVASRYYSSSSLELLTVLKVSSAVSLSSSPLVTTKSSKLPISDSSSEVAPPSCFPSASSPGLRIIGAALLLGRARRCSLSHFT